jgi:hypothetical protein
MTRFPLSWPAGWKRARFRSRAKFLRKTQGNYGGRELTVAEATWRLMQQLERMGVTDNDVDISTNIKLRLDGFPRSDQGEPADPGVAVYWRKRATETHKVMAIDQYDRVADNLAAIAASLEALRAIERHGGAVILERAFMGFDALPSPNDWRHVFGFEETPTKEQAKARYLELAKKRHPDAGGSETAMKELNAAWDSAQRELGA